MDPAPLSSAKGNDKFYGKYRGRVLDNIDPQQIGRVSVQVPDVPGMIPASWALPCVPAAGPQSGCFVVPPIGAQVWVEFEGGDIDFPIWTGGFWGTAAEVPQLAITLAPVPPGQNIVLQTTGQNAIVLSDSVPTTVSGGIVLKSPSGATIVVNDLGVHISNGKGASISLVGPVVTVNTTPFV
jgi:Type VI secretion system/phage-baseplate injector OB domain